MPADNPHPRPGAARLPSGVLSGHLPWLGVEGRFVVDERDRVRILRGVTLRGLERAAPHQGAFPVPVSPEEAALLRAWGATAVRLPLAQDLALEGRGEAEGEDYLEALDAAVEAAAAAGLYTIVQLSLLSSVLPTHRGPGGASYDPPLPDPGSLDFWGILARRYAHEPAVLFQLFGSPHDPGPGDATARLLPRVTWPVWRNHLLAMLGELRREHPRAVVLAPGLAGDLSGFPLRYSDGSQVANLIYGLELSASGGQEAVRRLLQTGRRQPAAVLGWRAVPLESRQVQALSPRLAQAGIHWLAAHWTEEPGALVSRQRGRLLPTPLGRAFQGALAAPLPAEFHLEPGARRQMFRLLPGREG
ncbi:MAG: glycoside hydrolase family 5 protein [Syntrophobacterales bacterium]|nr:glycoside hydrolase family 5 protein [Syntrophobacterales bacterium]